MSVIMNTFWSNLGVVGGNTSATNQYDLFKGLTFNDGFVCASQYDFFTHLGTNRYEFFKSYNSVDSNIIDEYTFYKNTSDVRIYDFYTFYTYAAGYISAVPVTPTPTPTQVIPTNTPTPTLTSTNTPTPSATQTSTPTPTLTSTPTPTLTSTSTPTPTLTSTPTPTPTVVPFNPGSLSGITYYNNYTDSGKVTTDTGGGTTTIASVLDSVSNTTIFSQGTKANQPLYSTHNGKNVAVAVNTTNGGLVGVLNMPQEYTIFAIVDNVSGTVGNNMFSLADNDTGWGTQSAGRHHQFKNTSTRTLYAIGFDAGGNPTLPNTNLTENTGWRLIIMRNRISGGTMITEIFNNTSTPVTSETIVGTPSSFTNKNIAVCAKDTGTAYTPIAEQGMYSRALSDSEITQLLGYKNTNYGAFDTDAYNYITQMTVTGASLTASINSATNTLFTSLKSNSLYTKLYSFYPMLGGKINPARIDGKLTNTLENVGGMSDSNVDISGLTTTTLGSVFLRTPFTSSNFGSQNSASFGCYVNVKRGQGNQMYMGDNNNNRGGWMYDYNTSTNNYNAFVGIMGGGNPGSPVAVTTNEGFWVNSRTGSTSFNVFRSGTLQYSPNISSVAPAGWKQAIGGVTTTSAGTASTYNGANRFAFAFWGDGLSNAEVSTLSTIVQTFQTSLGRQI